MFELTFLTDDPEQMDLARHYWAVTAQGEWAHTTTELAKKFAQSAAAVSSIARRSCVARTAEITCAKCPRQLALRSRTEYQQHKSNRSISRVYRSAPPICDKCRDEDLQAKLRQIRQRDDRARQTIQQWHDDNERNAQLKDYSAAPTYEAFLLFGLLFTAGDAWRAHELDAWETYAPRLFAHDADTANAYRYLAEKGWLVPSRRSRSGTIEFAESNGVTFHPLRVHWTLARDSSGLSYEELHTRLENVVQHASPQDLCDIWYRVGLSELRFRFKELHNNFGFRSAGWTPRVEESLRELLHECSVGSALTNMWCTFKDLDFASRDERYSKPHVDNMIPGSFRRTLEHHRAQNFAPAPWRRKPVAQEAIYTSLLFDELLRDGQDNHATLTGAALKRATDSGGTAPAS